MPETRTATETSRPTRAAPSLRSLPYRPFVVAALPRTGSYMLTTALDEHPEICCRGEALSPWRENPFPSARSAAEFLRRDVYLDAVDARAVGFKLLYQDGRREGFSDARRFLRASKVSVLHLRRRNLLRQVLSFELATRTDVWILDRGERRPVDRAVTLDPDELPTRFLTALAHHSETRHDFRGCPSLELCYEDLANDFENQAGRIFRFLEVGHQDVEPTTRRQRHLPLSRAITNYPAIVEALSGTSWEAFLDEDDPRYA